MTQAAVPLNGGRLPNGAMVSAVHRGAVVCASGPIASGAIEGNIELRVWGKRGVGGGADAGVGCGGRCRCQLTATGVGVDHGDSASGLLFFFAPRGEGSRLRCT